MSRLGLELPGALSLEEKLDLCAWADEHGFDDAWLAEISDPDAFVTLGVAATRTERIRLGTAIIPLGTRSIPVFAAASTTVAELAPERFALGLGVSSNVIVEQWNGMPRGRPLGRARESIALLRALLAGERSAQAGDFVASKGFRLRQPPASPPPIVLAALNVKMLELGGEIADGVFLNFLPLEAVPLALEAVARGAERAGRDALPELMLLIPTEVTDDPSAARARFGADLAFYLSAPPYQKALSWYGLEDEVARAKENWATGDIERVREGISAGLLDAIGAFGSAEHCKARLQAYWDAGVGTLGITPTSEDPRATLDHFARERVR
jgi:probable F420-dependent oxidoreductase